MEKAKATSKRPYENEDSLPSNSPSLKRHMGSQARSMKVATKSAKKPSADKNDAAALPHIPQPMALSSVLTLPGGQQMLRTPLKGLATPPQEPDVIDLCIDVVDKHIHRCTGGFPRFKDGDVVIDLGMLGDLTYRLHSSTLSRVSPWFSETLKQRVQEPDVGFGANYARWTGVRARYELNYDADLDVLVLARTTMTKVKVPEETVARPIRTTTATSITDSPISKSPAESLAASCQQQSPNTSPNIQVNTEQRNHHSKPAQLQSTQAAEVAQAAQIDNVDASEIPEGGHIGVHADSSSSSTVPGQWTIKIEEHHIKQEQDEAPDPGISIKNENPEPSQEDLMPTKESQVTPPTAELMAAYKGLFRTYCGQTPAIDKKDVNMALRQAEAIIKVAELYGSVSTIRPYLGNCLLQFGLNVYQAILQDPPRWLCLSLYLESVLIFKEAAVHIIGNLGYWPWSTVQLKDMPDDLVTFLNSKIEKLKRLIADVERTLFMTSIKVEGEDALLAPTDKRTINTWYVTQLWKQWFIHAVTQDEAPKPTGRADGAKYRAIAKGDDAYLPLETVTEHIRMFREPSRLTKWDKQTIEEDLKMFKIFAQKQVQELCVNNSMLSVADAGIEHLTCATIDGIDISWFTQEGIRVDD